MCLVTSLKQCFPVTQISQTSEGPKGQTHMCTLEYGSPTGPGAQARTPPQGRADGGSMDKALNGAACTVQA